MPVPFLTQLLIGIALQAVSFLLAPKPKAPKPPSLEDWEAPTMETGRPIPVVFGSPKITGPNILYTGDKAIEMREVDGKK